MHPLLVLAIVIIVNALGVNWALENGYLALIERKKRNAIVMSIISYALFTFLFLLTASDGVYFIFVAIPFFAIFFLCSYPINMVILSRTPIEGDNRTNIKFISQYIVGLAISFIGAACLAFLIIKIFK